MTQRLKTTLRFSPSFLIAIPLIIGSSMKIAGTAFMQDNFSRIGLLPLMHWIGLVELFSVLLFIFPKTHRYGLMLLTAHLGGAISAELISGGPFVVPAVILVLVWTAAVLRKPGFRIWRQVKLNPSVTIP